MNWVCFCKLKLCHQLFCLMCVVFFFVICCCLLVIIFEVFCLAYFPSVICLSRGASVWDLVYESYGVWGIFFSIMGFNELTIYDILNHVCDLCTCVIDRCRSRGEIYGICDTHTHTHTHRPELQEHGVQNS